MKICPICQNNMIEDCYIKDKANTLSDYELIEKNPNTYKKTHHVLKAALCKKCGHVELYVELKDSND